MNPEDKKAGKRPVDESLPPVSPSMMIPLTTHFNPRPPTVTTQPSSLVLSFRPVSASPMLPSAPWTPSASSFQTQNPSSSSSLNQLPSPLNLEGQASLTNSVGLNEFQYQTNQQQTRYGDIDNLIQQLLAITEKRNQVTQETQNLGPFNHVNGSFQGR